MPVRHTKHLKKALWICNYMAIVALSMFWSFTGVHSSTEILLSDRIELTPSADTFIAPGHPNVQYSDSKLIWLGYNTAEFKAERALLQFDLHDIQDKSQIVAATLTLYQAGIIGDIHSNMDVTISGTTSVWPQPITWNTQGKLTFTLGSSIKQTINTTLGEQKLNVTALVQSWMADAQHGNNFSVMLSGNETPSQHERSFWSKECDSNCSPPQLVIVYNKPTSMPVPPTPTPVPTPGVTSLTLSTQVTDQSPGGTIPLNGLLTYVIHYQNSISYTLSSAFIINQIPAQTELITDSIQTEEGVSVTNTDPKAGNTILWTFTQGIQGNHSGQVGYQVKRITDKNNDPIINKGAQIFWTYPDPIFNGSLSSNPTFNPGQFDYLPMVTKQ
ncbi:MAG: DNRLRE domain-containing protein [Chloroflexi bacterium]|nr:DNRLRE domain-containing protein [Chloroflexota bacterium]